jgi:hypothetical protein
MEVGFDLSDRIQLRKTQNHTVWDTYSNPLLSHGYISQIKDFFLKKSTFLCVPIWTWQIRIPLIQVGWRKRQTLQICEFLSSTLFSFYWLWCLFDNKFHSDTQVKRQVQWHNVHCPTVLCYIHDVLWCMFPVTLSWSTMKYHQEGEPPVKVINPSIYRD